MADSLYLSIWFPSFREGEMMPRAVSVLRQFPFSAVREGITYLSVHPVAWSEPTVLERRFTPGISPEEAAEVAGEFVHDDFAFVFEAFWDLWVPNEDEHGDDWVQRPVAVRFLVHGVQFDEGIYSEDGHVEVDFGLDTSFVYEGLHAFPAHRKVSARQHCQAGRILCGRRKKLRAERTRAVVRVGREPGAEADRQITADAVRAGLKRQGAVVC